MPFVQRRFAATARSAPVAARTGRVMVGWKSPDRAGKHHTRSRRCARCRTLWQAAARSLRSHRCRCSPRCILSKSRHHQLRQVRRLARCGLRAAAFLGSTRATDRDWSATSGLRPPPGWRSCPGSRLTSCANSLRPRPIVLGARPVISQHRGNATISRAIRLSGRKQSLPPLRELDYPRRVRCWGLVAENGPGPHHPIGL